jgi:hypothetical protein
MLKHVQETIAETKSKFEETSAGAKTANKDLSDVKTLIGVKDCVERVQKQAKPITLSLDQMQESLAFLASNGISKDKEIKQVKKLFDDWNALRKVAKETKKEIAPMIENESKKNQVTITKFEEHMKQYMSTMKQKDFYKYATGVVDAGKALDKVQEDIDNFKQNLDEL